MNLRHLVPLVLIAAAGCDQPTYTFSGWVYTSDRDLVQSVVFTGDPVTPEGVRPCSGVKVYLSRTDGGEPISDRWVAMSDADGHYSFTVDAKQLGNKEVYFVAAKEGYEPISDKITVGPLSPYLRTKVVLKKVTAK